MKLSPGWDHCRVCGASYWRSERQNDWVLEMTPPMGLQVVCPDHATPEEKLEAAVNDATSTIALNPLGFRHIPKP